MHKGIFPLRLPTPAHESPSGDETAHDPRCWPCPAKLLQQLPPAAQPSCPLALAGLVMPEQEKVMARLLTEVDACTPCKRATVGQH